MFNLFGLVDDLIKNPGGVIKNFARVMLKASGVMGGIFVILGCITTLLSVIKLGVLSGLLTVIWIGLIMLSIVIFAITTYGLLYGIGTLIENNEKQVTLLQQTVENSEKQVMLLERAVEKSIELNRPTNQSTILDDELPML